MATIPDLIDNFLIGVVGHVAKVGGINAVSCTKDVKNFEGI
jgi:hypothetical protein